jgi:hypothetical protein
MPLGPLHAACVQPAPKSRFVVSGLLRSKIKIKINGNATVNSGLQGCVSSRNLEVGHQSLWETPEVTTVRAAIRTMAVDQSADESSDPPLSLPS